MDILNPATPISPLRQRLIDDMTMREFSRETQRSYIRDVGRLAIYLGRRPDTATAEDLLRLQVEEREADVPVSTMNCIMTALRFFFTHTVDRPDLARKLVKVAAGMKLLCNARTLKANAIASTRSVMTAFNSLDDPGRICSVQLHFYHPSAWPNSTPRPPP